MIQFLSNYPYNNNFLSLNRYLKQFIITVIILLSIALPVMAEIPILRVGIFIDYKEVSIKGDKGLKIFDLSSGENLLINRDNQIFKIVAEPNGLKINQQSFKVKKGIKVIPIGDGFLQVQDKKYRGDIEINTNKSLLRVINIIEIEKYLYGVLKKEISPEWPAEVLKAQAIAARTFALANLNKYIDQGYNICATSNSQEYGGVFSENPKTNKAVNDTKGLVAVYDNKPINAVYHSDSGGVTENCEDVWGGFVPYLRSVVSEYEEIVSPPNHKWSFTLTEDEILKKLLQKGWKSNHINQVNIGEKTESGRVKSIDIIGENGEKITLSTNDFRLLIGPNLIKSTLFTMKVDGEKIEQSKIEDNPPEMSIETEKKVEKTVSDILNEDRDFTIQELISLLNRPKKIVKPEPKVEKLETPKIVEESKRTDELVITFEGRGSGHGVGLSQWGSYGMATKGFGYEEILKYYYQGIKISKIY